MATHLHPDLQASFDSGLSLPVLLLRVDLPDPQPPLALLLGMGQIEWDGVTFLGKHPDFGSLTALDAPQDGGGENAPNMSFVIAVPSGAAAALIASPSFQGSRVRLYVAGLDPENPQTMIGEPYLLFNGELDRPLITRDGGLEADAERTLDFECVSGFEKLFAATEAQRLADATHQSIWPGETGLASVTGIVQQIIWGPGERPGGSSGINYGAGSAVNTGGSRFFQRNNFVSV